MPDSEQHEEQADLTHGAGGEDGPSISEEAILWQQLFARHLELNQFETFVRLPAEPNQDELRAAGARAVMMTLRDSGMNLDEMVGVIGEMMVEQKHASTSWGPILNSRRIELIDKELQHTISLLEAIELEGLTRQMRKFVYSEQNFPMRNAETLYRALTHPDPPP